MTAHDILGEAYTYWRCMQCESLFLWPQQMEEAPSEYYNPQYYGESENKFSTPGVEKVLHFFREQRVRRLLRFLPTKNEASILDVGCGNGSFLHILGKKGNFTLFGSELPGQAAERSRRFPEIQLSTSGAFHEGVSPGSLNAVTMFHVIEHLPDPITYLDKISLALKKGGVFYVSFPNIDSWQARLFRDKWLHLDPPRHLVLFHPEAFSNYMERIGFERAYRTSLSTEQNPFGMVQSLLNWFSGPRDLLYESMKGNEAYCNTTGKWKLFIHRLFFVLGFPLFAFMDFIAAAFTKGATLTYVFKKTS